MKIRKDQTLYSVYKTVTVSKRHLNWIDDVLKELEYLGIFFPIQFFIDNEWYCFDYSQKIALPYYIFDPHLVNLEKVKTGFVEGTAEKQFKKILRHEIGHAFDHLISTFKNLNHIKTKYFGSGNEPYPQYYSPNFIEKSFFDYLGNRYYQSHSSECFAEVFASFLEYKGKIPSCFSNEKDERMALGMNRLLKQSSKLFKLETQKKKFKSLVFFFTPQKKISYSLGEGWSSEDIQPGSYPFHRNLRTVEKHFQTKKSYIKKFDDHYLKAYKKSKIHL